MTSTLAQEIAAALREAAPPVLAPISQTELAKYNPSQRQVFASILARNGFTQEQVEAKIVSPIGNARLKRLRSSVRFRD
jgi:hypothetical protein